jgi:hypothetical protein
VFSRGQTKPPTLRELAKVRRTEKVILRAQLFARESHGQRRRKGDEEAQGPGRG